MTVTITVSDPYVLVAGSWTGMRPVGQRRDYRATVLGVDFHDTSKAQIRRVIRTHVYRQTGSSRVTFTFQPA